MFTKCVREDSISLFDEREWFRAVHRLDEGSFNIINLVVKSEASF